MKKVLLLLALCATSFSLKANYSFDQIYNPTEEGAKIMQAQGVAAETVTIYVRNEPIYNISEGYLIANNRILASVIQGIIKYPIMIYGNCWLAHTEAGNPSEPLMDAVDIDGFLITMYPGESSCSAEMPDRNGQPVYILTGRVSATVSKINTSDNTTYIIKL